MVIDSPDPKSLNETAGRVEPFRSSNLHPFWVQASHGVQNEHRHPLLAIERHLGEHGEASPYLLTEERAVLRRR
jgi:hypothetical protein